MLLRNMAYIALFCEYGQLGKSKSYGGNNSIVWLLNTEIWGNSFKIRQMTCYPMHVNKELVFCIEK